MNGPLVFLPYPVTRFPLDELSTEPGTKIDNGDCVKGVLWLQRGGLSPSLAEGVRKLCKLADYLR